MAKYSTEKRKQAALQGKREKPREEAGDLSKDAHHKPDVQPQAAAPPLGLRVLTF